MAENPQKLSGPFAWGSGFLLLIFVFLGARYLCDDQASDPLVTIAIGIILFWSGCAAAMLTYWGYRADLKYKRARNAFRKSVKARRKAIRRQHGLASPVLPPIAPKPEPGIGHPTLEMIGGLSAAIIAAVTLALIFLAEEKTSFHQEQVSCRTLEAEYPGHPEKLPDFCKHLLSDAPK